MTGEKEREREREREIESGRISTPTLQSVSLYAILHTDGGCKGTQTAHCIQAHTFAPTSLQFCVRETQARVWINSMPIYGLQEVLRLRSSKQSFSLILSAFPRSDMLSALKESELVVLHKNGACTVDDTFSQSTVGFHSHLKLFILSPKGVYNISPGPLLSSLYTRCLHLEWPINRFSVTNMPRIWKLVFNWL